MKRIRQLIFTVIAVLLLAESALALAADQQKSEDSISWREQYAYSLGK